MRICLAQGGPFQGFGACRLAANAEPSLAGMQLPPDDRGARRLVRRECPAAPGVYGMIDAEGQLIYVGKSKSLRDRLVTYFAPASSRSKSRRIIDHTRRLVWEPSPHEFTALVRELELIRRWRPRFNVQGQPERWRSTFLCLGREPAAYAYLAARPSARDGATFGPIPSRRHFCQAVRRLNDCFRLRDCPDRVPILFSDQRELFRQEHVTRCLRRELGACLAPCAAACSRAAYDEQLRAARRFLEGEDSSMLERLKDAMLAAAATQQFERAAALRDALADLALLDGYLGQLRTVRQCYSFVYPLPGYDGRETWHLVRQGEVAAAAPSPRGRRLARKCLSLLDQVFQPDGTVAVPEPPEDLGTTQLVALWFRRNPEELRRTIPPDAARSRCAQVLAPSL